MNRTQFLALLLSELLAFPVSSTIWAQKPAPAGLSPEVHGPLREALQKSYLDLFEIAPKLEFSQTQIEAMRKYLEKSKDTCAGSFNTTPTWGRSPGLELTQAEAFFNMLASKSGGQAFFPRFETAYKDIARSIVLMLQQQYRITYDSAAAADGKFHRLKLEAFQIAGDKRRDYKPRVREGWRR